MNPQKKKEKKKEIEAWNIERLKNEFVKVFERKN